MRDVKIKICDKQIYETHEDENETDFVGQLSFKNESIYITYKDEEMGVTTIVKIKDHVIYVKRLGNLKGNLEFNTEKSHRTLYATPYGEMEIEFKTKKVDVYILEKAVKICIDYTIMMQGKKISDNIYMLMAN